MAKEVKTEKFHASTGHDFTIVSVPSYFFKQISLSLEEEFEREGKSIKVPTYEIKTVAGDVEIHDLDPESLEHPEDPEETERRKEAWTAYQRNLVEFKSEESDRLADASLYYGVDLRDDEEYTSGNWVKPLKRFGLEVPEDEVERKLFYLKNFCFNQADIIMLIARIQFLSLSGVVDQKAIEAAEDFFRGQMSEAGESFLAMFKDKKETDLGLSLPPGGDDGGEGVGSQS